MCVMRVHIYKINTNNVGAYIQNKHEYNILEIATRTTQ